MTRKRAPILQRIITLYLIIMMTCSRNVIRSSALVVSPAGRLWSSRNHSLRWLVVTRGKHDNNHSEAPPPTTTTTTLEDGLHESEIEIKKSRFIGYSQRVESWKEAQDVLATIRTMHPKARHVCFGMYVLTNGMEQERCSDDGEPTGTAGVPILGAIKGQDNNLVNVVCIVVRYFGGIKLGAGGLIRAYGGAARLVLRESPVISLIPKSTIHIRTSSAYVGYIYDAVRRVGGALSDEDYNDKGDLLATATCETQYLTRLQESIRDSTKGNAEFLDKR